MKATQLLFILFLLLGCTKANEGPACKTCVTTQVTNYLDVNTTLHPTIITTDILCDWKWKEVDGKRISVKSMEGKFQVEIVSTTVCNE